MKRESFVIHSEYIDDLPDEFKAAFLVHIYNYGINGVEPEISGLERTVWLKIKRRIDSDTATYDKRVKNLRQNRPAETSDTDNSLSATENNLSDTENSSSVTDNGLSDTDNNSSETENDLSGGVYVSVSDIVNECVSDDVNVNDNVNVNVRVCESAGIPPGDTPASAPETQPMQEYAHKVFDVFAENSLPCCNNNRISFYQRDFRQGIEYLHRNIAGLHSDEVIEACANYASIAKNPALYKGYSRHLSFDQLVTKKWFSRLLPANFLASEFLEYSGAESPPKEEQRTEDPEQAEKLLFSQMERNSEFIPAIFRAYKKDWEEEGFPTGGKYLEFQKKKELAPYGRKLKAEFMASGG